MIWIVFVRICIVLGTFCKPKFGNFDGNGPRPVERCETKWRIFAKIHPNVRLEGPGTEQNFRFGSAWPVRVCPCGHVLRQFGIAGRRINFCSFVSFSVMSSFSRSSSSTASISSSPAAVCSPAPKSKLLRNHRSLPRRVSLLVRKPEKQCILFVESRG